MSTSMPIRYSTIELYGLASVREEIETVRLAQACSMVYAFFADSFLALGRLMRLQTKEGEEALALDIRSSPRIGQLPLGLIVQQDVRALPIDWPPTPVIAAQLVPDSDMVDALNLHQVKSWRGLGLSDLLGMTVSTLSEIVQHGDGRDTMGEDLWMPFLSTLSARPDLLRAWTISDLDSSRA